MGWKIEGWNDLKNFLVVIIAVLIIIGLLTDFITWKNALNMLKKEIPKEGIGTFYIREFGYIPFVWKGDFRFIGITATGTKEEIRDPIRILLQIGEHQPFATELKGGFGFYKAKYDEENDWYNQDFKEAEIFVKILDFKESEAKVLIYIQTEERVWFRIFKMSFNYVGCSTKYWYGRWKK